MESRVYQFGRSVGYIQYSEYSLLRLTRNCCRVPPCTVTHTDGIS